MAIPSRFISSATQQVMSDPVATDCCQYVLDWNEFIDHKNGIEIFNPPKKIPGWACPNPNCQKNCPEPIRPLKELCIEIEESFPAPLPFLTAWLMEIWFSFKNEAPQDLKQKTFEILLP